jgi:pimeloyl-ACP methyl ester carboxylesterase
VSPTSRRRFLSAAGALALSACAQLPGGAERKSGFAEVNGTRLYYETAGAGDPVVLLHSFTFDVRMWDDQFDVLARNHRVIRYDARGFGRSALPVAGVPYSHHEDLAALLAHLDARQPHLVGHSMGGRFALDYAVTTPRGYRSLTVMDTWISGWPWSKAFVEMYTPVLTAGRRKDVAAAKAAWLALPVFAPVRERPALAARVDQMVRDYSGWHFVNADPAVPVAPATITRLGSIDMPVLVVVGERDLPDFVRMSEQVAREAKRSRRVTVPATGHFASMESPREVNAALVEFLAGA